METRLNKAMCFCPFWLFVGFSENISKTLVFFDGYFIDNVLSVIIPLFAC